MQEGQSRDGKEEPSDGHSVDLEITSRSSGNRWLGCQPCSASGYVRDGFGILAGSADYGANLEVLSYQQSLG